MNEVVAKSYAAAYSRAQLEEIRLAALQAHAEGSTVTRSFEGSSLTVSQENAAEVLECVAAALEILEAQEQDEDADLRRQPLGIALDFSRRRIE